MRRPILNDIVNNFEKRSKSPISEGVYDGLAFIIKSQEKDPRKTKKENEAVENPKGSEGGLLGIFTSLIKPEDLEESDEWDKGITCIEGQSKRKCDWDEVSFF